MIDWSLNNLLTDPTVEDMSMKHESYRLWKEAVMVCTKVPSQNFPQGMHKYHKAYAKAGYLTLDHPKHDAELK